MTMQQRFAVVAIAWLLPTGILASEPLTIAVASNFRGAASEIAAAFSKQTTLQVRLVSGSTGKLYAQIVNGAPFDIFLAADRERPRRLLESGIASPGTLQAYAEGALVVVSMTAELAGQDCERALATTSRRVAIANAETAPYGRAAEEYLRNTGLWAALEGRLVRGENVMQALQFVATENAVLGIVSASQLTAEIADRISCRAAVSRDTHRPVLQFAVVLQRSTNGAAAHEFMQFLRGPQVAAVIEKHGYRAVAE